MAILVAVLQSVAFADKPPTDRAVNALKLTKEMARKDLCVVQRTLFSYGAWMLDLTYAVDGRVTRRERWRREPSNEPAELEIGETFEWNGRELTITTRPGQPRAPAGVRRYRYDEAGLPIYYEKQPDNADVSEGATKVELTWNLTKLDQVVPIYRESSTDPHALNLPFQHRFTGTAAMKGTKSATGESQEATVTYGPNGTLELEECAYDAQGRERACVYDQKFSWVGSHLVARWVDEPSARRPGGKPEMRWRTQYRYDKQHRLVRAQYEEVEEDKLEVQWVSTLEYRCKNVEGYRSPYLSSH